MMQRILVPLDGSARAERALPVATRIARNTGATLLLLRVSTLVVDYHASLGLAGISEQAILDSEQEKARAYLESICHLGDLATLQVGTVALSGTPAETLLAYIEANKVDLVVMCSHGYTGFKRWALGSVAEHVTRHSSVPVLVLRERSPKPQELTPEAGIPLRALVALDGFSFAEAALIPTIQLVGALAGHGQGVVHLMQVVQMPTVEQAMEYERYDDEVRRQILSEAGSYLQSVCDRLMQGPAAEFGVKVVWSVEESKDVVKTLIHAAELGEGADREEACDFMALATHGRSGLRRLTIGSVTERVMAKSQLPLLIVRPQEVYAASSATRDQVEAIEK